MSNIPFPSPFRSRLLLATASFAFALGIVAGCGEDREPPPAAESREVAGWPTYGGDPGGSRYSPLAEIHRGNVDELEVAWTYRTGDYPEARPEVEKTSFQATPILDEGTLYFCSGLSRAFAIDAETGEERWIFDARPDLEKSGWNHACRGVALWRDPEAASGEPCAKRVLMGTIDAGLVAIDANTGAACRDFGEAGRVDLNQGIGHVRPGETHMTSPPTLIGDVVVTGALVADNRRTDAPGGVVRGWDVRTGELRWAFDPVNPGVPPLPSAPDGSPRFHRGTPNAWSILSADPERGLVFVPFGSPSPDFYGGHRSISDHYSNAVVALDGETGQPVWSFQVVHHDLWDYDIASQPTLIDVVKDGRTIPALAQATKMGFLFLLDRETGVPIYPVEERPVPQSNVEGERTSATQPFPTHPPPLHPTELPPEDAWGLTFWDRGKCADLLREMRNEGIFTPPEVGRWTVQYPGTAGGSNWGSVAFDPERRLMVLNQSYIPQIHRLVPREERPGMTPENRPRGLSLQEGTPYMVEHGVLLSPLGIPCNPPPWGTLLALDLDTGEKRWEVPLGTVREMTPVPISITFGMPSMGGAIVTAGGLAFIGAAMDDTFRAFDVETGEEIWSDRLPAGGQATPMTYRVSEGGRQFVVIAAGGHASLRTKLGDYVIAYALP